MQKNSFEKWPKAVLLKQPVHNFDFWNLNNTWQ